MATKTLSLRTRRNSRLHGRSRAGNILNFLFLALIGVFMALPMVYAVSSAFKPPVSYTHLTLPTKLEV